VRQHTDVHFESSNDAAFPVLEHLLVNLLDTSLAWLTKVAMPLAPGPGMGLRALHAFAVPTRTCLKTQSGPGPHSAAYAYGH
jgi:hypothetical protein